MSMHRITAGSGYEYLTRQVARHDSTENARASLASYYSEKGEIPGRWVGSGMASVDGMAVGDAVDADHMRALFGCGYHPLAATIAQEYRGAGRTQKEYERAIALGQPFHVYSDDISPFRIEVARRFDAHNRAQGKRGDAPIPLDARARIRTEVARAMFVAEYGRQPLDSREISGHLARLSRQHTTAVAGFDLTFSPVKSVSALWAVADPNTAARIERAHNAAVTEALSFIEAHALYTRLGSGGVRQVDTKGLVAAAFTHRDSRAGDPDLHTHVAVANKVQTEDGRWLSIHSRVLYKANVSASEVYNTTLERVLAEDLGVRFATRPGTPTDRRPVREIEGVSPVLLEAWSSRRRVIEERRAGLAQSFQATHGRPPTAIEQIALAQQATLDTREAKHEPRTLAEQRTTWRTQALEVCGGEAGLDAMITTALHPAGRRPDAEPGPLDEAWFDQTAAGMVDTMQRSRSTWQTWHLRAEAYRQARIAEVPRASVESVVDQLVACAGGGYSMPVTHPTNDPISEPRALRRRDGTSVYATPGGQLFTSIGILAAEQRLVATAGRTDGFAAPDTAVDLALLETTANGFELNPGQAALVRGMATSGARLQVAIAPAGSGKTTAMAALGRAWIEAGGTVLGLAPSAAAADQLRPQLSTHTDTLAKLVWHIEHGASPAWMDSVNARTLVVIDEAGMADTMSLDTAVGWLVDHGASVRLVGDDQQLAAIGAGGVLRDIEAHHGVLRLRDLVRFGNPAESAASLALREGRPEAIGFYLDQGRVHVGDQTTLLDDLFTAWTIDREQGLDSIMLAPTRNLVADLNRRARDQRLAGQQPAQDVTLADGNRASVGDTIITRLNDRRLRLGTTNWVKNGDRWTVEELTAGGLRVRHARTGQLIQLPASYVVESVELGYASTIHTAQGVSVDTVHGLADASLARQPLYTMLTRGRQANHVYLEVVGDGSEHTVIRPETVNPDTPTDLLEHILARDESPISATTQQRLAQAPEPQLFEAAHRYADALGVAAETLAGTATITDLERKVEALLPNLTDAPDWPVLRTQLLILAADGHEPITALAAAFTAGPIDDARDPATVLAWRLDGQLAGGPLPWLNRLPNSIADHPRWGPYLTRRAQRVSDLAGQISDSARTATEPAPWLAGSIADPTPGTLAAIAVWRAAHGVPDTDLRPTGPRVPEAIASRVQHALDHRVGEDHNPALSEWAPLLRRLSPMVDHDPYTATVARLLAQLSGAGVNAHRLVTSAAGEGPLPDDHAAGALWWRINRHLTPDTARTLDIDTRVPADWAVHLTDTLGDELAHAMQESPYWTALSLAIEDGLQRGWSLDSLLTGAHATTDLTGNVDAAQALAWRIAITTDPNPYTDDHITPDAATEDTPPEDLYDGYSPPEPTPLDLAANTPDPAADDPYPDLELTIEEIIRNTMTTPEPTALQVREQLDRRDAWNNSPATPERLALINAMAADYYSGRLPGSWVQPYLTDRFGVDLTGDADYRPGYAPDGWTHLVDHLHHQGVQDEEMITVGVAGRASTGRLIDRFRDRVVFPISNEQGLVIGFAGRRNPNREGDPKTPKYLNTADTLLFHKSAQLFVPPRLLADGATPVIVEGPMDAVAVTLAGAGRYVGVAPLGTSLTDEQAQQLHRYGRRPIVATDNDPAGRAAAERDFWQLAPYQLDPRYAELPDGADPADMIKTGQAQELRYALDQARPLAHHLLTDRVTRLAPCYVLPEALRVIATQPATEWEISEAALIGATGMPAPLVRLALKEQINAFNTDPRGIAQDAHQRIRALHEHHTQPTTPAADPPPPKDGPNRPRRHHPQPISTGQSRPRVDR